MPAKRATIYSLAKELGIHPSTVSRAFSRPDLVNETVRQRILTKASEVDYQPNKTARGLITGRLGMVGLLIPDIENPFFPPLVRVIQRAASQDDLNVMLLDSGQQPEVELELVRRLRGQIDGLILVSPRSPMPRIKEAVGEMPMVAVNRSSSEVSTTVIDNSPALREAGNHLYGLGHRSIALLRGPSGSWAAQRRASAVKDWARRTNVELIELGPFPASYDGGREAADRLVAGPATAAFAFDDLMACGTVAGLAERGLRVPDDMSLVGCDDVLLARTLTPALTTVTAPLGDLGRAALAQLQRHLADRMAEPQAATFTGALSLRSSTGPVPPRRG